MAMQMNITVSKRRNLLLIFLLILLRVTTIEPGNAQNPIVQTMYTADPAPMVWNDRFTYTTHDADDLPGSPWTTGDSIPPTTW